MRCTYTKKESLLYDLESARQAEILDEMGRHQTADENFYITANTVMNLAARSREIFLSSEVTEKC